MRGGWEYDPIPRYRLYEKGVCVAEIEADTQGPHSCNNFDPDGEVWCAVIEDEYFGRFPTLKDAQETISKRILKRGFSLVIPADATVELN